MKYKIANNILGMIRNDSELRLMWTLTIPESLFRMCIAQSAGAVEYTDCFFAEE